MANAIDAATANAMPNAESCSSCGARTPEMSTMPTIARTSAATVRNVSLSCSANTAIKATTAG